MASFQVVRLTESGRITLPAAMRRKLGWAPECQLVIEAGEGKVVIHRLKTVEELSGIFHDAVRGRKPLSHEEETRIMEQAVAEQVAAE